MEVCNFLVIHDATKKILKCTKEEVLDQIKIAFNLEKQFTIEYFDESFAEWVCIDQLHELPSKAKISVIVAGNENVSSISDSTGDTLPALPDLPTTSYSSTQPSTKRWILSWELPALPKHVIEEIEQNLNGCISSHARRNIIQVLFNSLSAQTPYPSSLEYRSVCMTLLKTYPMLADKDAKDPAGTWMESLRQKFRDVRRPMVNNEKVKAMKRKYGFIKSSPSSATSREQEDCPSSAKRNLTERVENLNIEDEASIEAHMRFMASEMKKKRKDLKLIDDRMGRTYLHRRREVQEGHLTIEELLEKYPALTEPTCLLSEAERIFGKNVREQLNEHQDSMWIKLLQICGKPPERMSNALSVCKQDRDVALLRIPHLFKEKVSELFLFTENPTSPYPCIFGKEKLTLYVPRKELCSVDQMMDAVCLILAAYWIFDIEFNPKSRKSLEMYAYLMKVKGGERSIAVQRLINKL